MSTKVQESAAVDNAVDFDITPETQRRIELDTFTGRTEAMVDAFAATGKAVLFEGPIGFGKTSFFRDYAAKRNRPMYLFNVALQQAEDLAGHPRAVTKEIDGKSVEVTVKTMNEWFYHVVSRDHNAIIVMDEIKNADPDRQAAFLTFMQDREIDGVKLPDEVTIIALCNPTDISANGFDFSGPAANRFCHVKWEFPRVEMIDLMSMNFGRQTPEHEQEFRSLVTTYLRSNEGMLHRMPEEKDELEAGWPSPRSWDNAIKVVSNLPDHDGLRDRVIMGYVGNAAAVDFRAWTSNNRVPAVRPILQGIADNPGKPSAYPWDDKYASDSSTVLRFCHNLVATVSDSHELFDAACSFLVEANAKGFGPQSASMVPKIMRPDVRGPENTRFPVEMVAAFNDQFKQSFGD